MTKMIKMTEAEKLKAKLSALPPKMPDALPQKELVQVLAAEFKSMLAQGYTIEQAHAEFITMEGADLKLSTFRTYLNEALKPEPAPDKLKKKRASKRKATATATSRTANNTLSKLDTVSADDDRIAEVAMKGQTEITRDFAPDHTDDYLESMSLADIERLSGPSSS